MELINLKNVAQAVKSFVHRTPVLSSALLNETYGSKLLFKCENFQRGGSFKIRGAFYSALQKTRGGGEHTLAGHSSGNFGQALAMAAFRLGAKAVVAMPENAPAVKSEAVRRYGAQILWSGNDPADREELLDQYMKDHPEAIFLHPSDDLDMIRGNATCALEFITAHPSLEVLCVPVGGGGLLAGTALAAGVFPQDIQVYGAEPEGADDARRSFHFGKIVPSIRPDTIADGLRTQLGPSNFPIIRVGVTDILTVSDAEIIAAMKDIFRFLKIVAEPSSAVPLAVVKKYPEYFENKTTGIIISGGNIDFSTLCEILK